MQNLNNQQDVWIIDDDGEDHDLITEIFKETKLPYPLNFFTSGKEMLNVLAKASEAPFMIISDVNLPAMDGFELREKLLASHNNKFHSVPFIFWSNTASETQIRKAFELRCHGFFIKEPNYNDWKVSLIHIIEYWRRSCTPSKEDKPDAPQN